MAVVETPPAPGTAPLPAIGSLNILETSIGAKGYGKSTMGARRAYELQRQYGAYVIGHSMGARIGRKLPDGMYGGAELPITYHRTVAEMERGLRRKPERWHIVAPPMQEEDPTPDRPKSTADDVLRYAVRLSYALRLRAWRDAHPWAIRAPKVAEFDGLPVRPIVVIIDEGIAVKAARAGDQSKHADNDWFHELLISLRHMHILLLWNIQNPTARTWKLLNESSAIHCFHLRNEWAQSSLRAAGASEDQLDEIGALPPFEHVTLTP